VLDLIITLPYNDREILEQTLKRTWFDVAAIIVEPIMGNTAAIEPQDDFLQFIRARCDEYGILMIMDEVKTGFRVALGGAQELYKVTADLATYAKSMGNGYPVAAFGGRREVMDQIGKGVSHAGTYSGNVVGTAAADAVLDILATTDALAVVAARGRALQKGIGDVLEAADLPFVITGHPSMFTFIFTDATPREFRDWAKSNQTLYEEIMVKLIERGVMPDPDSREPWFLSAAHSEQDVADTLTAFEEAVKEAKQAH
jgi:glutamate-1-semialdehyde 2,1-aminomutase